MIPLGYHLPGNDHIGFLQSQQPGKFFECIYDHSEAHLLTIAPTGAGKGRSNVIPTCLTYPGSLIVLDPKGEAARVTSKARRRFGKVYIIDPFKLVTKHPAKFNPMDIVLTEHAPEQQGIMLAQALQDGYGGFKSDPFWDNKANDILSAAMIHQLTTKKSFAAFRKGLVEGDVDYNIAAMLDSKTVKNQLAEELYSTYLSICSEKTRPSVLSTAQQHLTLLGEPCVLDSLEGPSSFSVYDLLKGKPMTIYLVIPPNKLKAFVQLVRLWVVSFMYLLTERKVRPKIPTLFIIDECGNLGKLDSLVTSVTLLRSYGLRLWMMFQDLGQLKTVYDKEWTTMVNNCAVIQAFGFRNQMMAKEIAEVIGGISHPDLLRMKQDMAVMATPGKPGRLIKRLDYLNDEIFNDSGFAENRMYKNSRAAAPW
ncbi:MAG: type IV secretory system conjugative DNA transfer family protein [Chitinophagaceae bacterium]|nr:type IV secretory system conjugative DNA transfer family protein [Chitinophagaceae bacterium]